VPAVKMALPKGELEGRTLLLLNKAGLSPGDYGEGSRSYRPQCAACPELFLKVFHEKDIAIQVAIGNYDLGICRRDWVDELLAKFPSDAVVKLKDLDYGRRNLYAVAAESAAALSLETIKNAIDDLRIVSEYPNLAFHFALRQRLRRFRVFPVWGSAESYLPENADLALIADTSEEGLRERGFISIMPVAVSGACIIANRASLERKDLGPIMAALFGVAAEPSAADAPLADGAPRVIGRRV